MKYKLYPTLGYSSAIRWAYFRVGVLALSSSSHAVVIVSISVGRIDPGCPDVPQGGRSCSIYSFPRWPMNNNCISNSKERAFHAQAKDNVVLLSNVVLFLFRRFSFRYTITATAEQLESKTQYNPLP